MDDKKTYKIELTSNEVDAVIQALGNKNIYLNDKQDDDSDFCIIDGWELGSKIFIQKNKQQTEDIKYDQPTTKRKSYD